MSVRGLAVPGPAVPGALARAARTRRLRLERGARTVHAILPPEAAEALERLRARWGGTITAVVARAVIEVERVPCRNDLRVETPGT